MEERWDPRKECSPWSAGYDFELALKTMTPRNFHDLNEGRMSPWSWRPPAYVDVVTRKNETDRRQPAGTNSKSPWSLPIL